MIGVYLGWWKKQPEAEQRAILRKQLKLFVDSDPEAVIQVGELLPSADARLAYQVLVREIRRW